MNALLLMVTGSLAGTLGALVGVGGGIVVVPALVLGFGIPMAEAVPVSLLCVVASSCGAAAAYVEQGLSDVRLATVLEVATVSGALAGGAMAGIAPAWLLASAFGVFALYISFQLMMRGAAADPEPMGPFTGTYQNLPWGLGGSFLAGGLSALLGVGGGPVKVPLMRYVMGLPFRRASATSNLTIGVTGAVGAVSYALAGQLSLELAAPLVVGVLVGAVLGAKLMVRVPTAVLKRVLAVVLLVVAGQMIWKGGEALWSMQ